MRKIISVGLLSLLILSGVALAQQSGEQGKSFSMKDMMPEMMKGEKNSERGMEGMMGMMKMMEQCGAMAEQCCSTSDTGKSERSESN